jgi:exocyst complex component 1
VQTQNQRALLSELEKLLVRAGSFFHHLSHDDFLFNQQTVHVDSDALVTLTQGSLEKTASITRLEEAATELYKALLAGRDTGRCY